MRDMRGLPMAMASLNLSRMFCGSATPEFSRTNLQARSASAQQPHKWHGVSDAYMTQASEKQDMGWLAGDRNSLISLYFTCHT